MLDQLINSFLKEEVNCSSKQPTFVIYIFLNLVLLQGDEEADDSNPGEVIKKGEDEYIVVVSGAKDTGLSGSYWQTENLPSRRRCTITPPPTPAKSPEAGAKRPKEAGEQPSPPAKKSRTKEEPTTPTSAKSPRGRKRKEGGENNEELNDKPEEAASNEDTTKTNGVQQNRNISCLSDANAAGSSQREVVVECFAPYDDHRWVNIGKERNGNPADAVQYARALRPPYQLLSFLRIKGNCAKGKGCSNKNTMVSFVKYSVKTFTTAIFFRETLFLWILFRFAGFCRSGRRNHS